MKIVLALILAATLLSSSLGQTRKSGNAKSKDACSPSISGDNNTINFTYCGSSPEETKKILELLTEINKKRDGINGKVDQVLAILSPHERAHLSIESVTIDIETFGAEHPIWMNIAANISGFNRSQIPTAKWPMVLAAVRVSPLATADEELKMFRDPGGWANERYWSNDVLHTQEPFSFTKREGVTTSIQSDDPFHDPERMLRSGELLVYVFIKTSYGDRYGEIPEERQYKRFKYEPMTQKFKQYGLCNLTVASLVVGQ